MNSLLLVEKGRLLRNADTTGPVIFARCSHTGHLLMPISKLYINSMLDCAGRL